MITRRFSIFLSKVVIVGSLCTLLWVLRPMSQAGQAHGGTESAATVTETPPIEKVEVPTGDIPKAKAVYDSDADESAPMASGPEEEQAPKAKPVAPYHSATDRPDFAGQTPMRKKEVFRHGISI